MAEQHADLERRLRELASDVAFAATPDLAATVEARLAARPRRRLGRRPGLRLALAVALALLLPAAAALAVSPRLRDAVLEVLGLRGARVERRAITPRTTAPPLPADAGRRASLARAQAAVRFRILLPRALGPPAAVYLDRQPPGGAVTVAFRPWPGVRALRPGLGAVLTELRGDLVPGFIFKTVGPGVPVVRVTVHGEPGLWIGGSGHAVIYQAPNGQMRDTPYRLSGPTLLWQHGNVLFRLESRLGRRQALRVARSIT